MWPEYAQFVGIELVADEVHGKHFGHHPHFQRRYPSRCWVYTWVEVPIARLVFGYPKIGDGAECPGVVQEVTTSELQDLRDVPIQRVVDLIRPTMDGSDLACSRKRILRLMELEPTTMQALPETTMVVLQAESAILVEGNHRCLALGLLNVEAVRAVLFDRIRLHEDG